MQSLLDSETTLRVLIHAPTEGRLLIDADGTILALNDRACERMAQLSGQRLSGRPDRLLGICVYDIFAPDIAKERRARNAKVLRTGKIARFEDEREGRWMENTICPVFDENGKVTRLVILSHDITNLKDAQKELRSHAEQLEQVNRYLTDALGKLSDSEKELRQALKRESERARHDALTGVLNHRALLEELTMLIEGGRSSPLTVAMVDVDCMKAANDAYGHQLGDAVLKLVARALAKDGARVGRYGGDEFIAILPNSSREKGEQYRRKVERAVNAIELTDADTGSRVPVMVSLGFAVYPDDSEEPRALIKIADSAMYAGRRLRRVGAHQYAATAA